MARRPLLAIIILMAMLSANGPVAEAQMKTDIFSVGLIGGYTAMSMSAWGVDWYTYDDNKKQVRVNDDSYLDPGPQAGLFVTYQPVERFLNLGFTLEGFYQQYDGKIKGTYGEGSPEQRIPYDFDATFKVMQGNFLLTLFFSNRDFAPYLQAGFGAVEVEAEIDGELLRMPGAVGVVAWGAQYKFVEWFALGGQVRAQDLFALAFDFEPDETNLLHIESQFVPLSILLHTTFYF
jgi:hypothetical protein